MSARDDIEQALADAGHEQVSVRWFFTGTDSGERGWYYRQSNNDDWQFLASNKEDAIEAVAAMPNPNIVTEDEVREGPKVVSPETYPDLYDEFNNPLDSPFGHR